MRAVAVGGEDGGNDGTRNKMKKAKSYFTNAMLIVLSVAFVGVLGEVAMRVYHLYKSNVPFFASIETLKWNTQARHAHSPLLLDKEYGWISAPNYVYTGQGKNRDGSRYRLEVSFDDKGFRKYGNPSSGKKKILVIGDSFTQALDASDDKTYYTIVGGRLDLEVFAYGAGGFGTLQEYMVLDRYFDQIKPDIVLWQFCTNDFYNNSAELESQSKKTNNGMMRPYLAGSSVEYVLPTSSSVKLRSFAVRESRFLYFLLSRWDMAVATYYASVGASSVEDEIEREGARHAGFVRAAETTDKILAMVRARTGGVPVVAFLADNLGKDGWPYESVFRELAEKNDIRFIRGIHTAVEEARRQGLVVHMADGSHWNENGHRIVAENIARELAAIAR